MSILTAQNIAKVFGADELFSDISVQIAEGDKIALVGPNGAGKTTLINILIGHDPPSAGNITYKRGLRIGHLPQRPSFESEHSLWEEMLKAYDAVLALGKRLTALEEAMADPTRANEHDSLLEQYGSLQHAFEDGGGYIYEFEIKRVLQGLGFAEREFSDPLNQLSGGQKTRALLARLLLEQNDLLVLDEPTNHLDIQAVEWLEGYLKKREGSLLMVSHDRYFMDRVVDNIWELDYGMIETYRGNYSHYTQQREERYERLMKEYESQQAFIEKEQEYIRKHMGSQNTSQAKGRLRRLERMMSGTDRHGHALENQWLIQKPRTRHNMHLELNSVGRTGNEVLRVDGLQIGYPPHHDLFEIESILLMRQEVAAIIGANGAGKSTFFRTLLKQLNALGGKFRWGANVKIGYFAQAHENLNDNNSVLDELLTVKNLPISEARNYLAQFMFMGEDVFRAVSTLSGGERGRLALAKLSLAGTNVLLLDEPTNHLDIPAQEVLQTVLAEYDGTILMISHDRYIIDALATQIWRIKDKKMQVFKGSYSDYAAAQNTTDTSSSNGKSNKTKEEPEKVKKNTSKHPSGLNPHQRQKRLEYLESTIHDLEAKLKRISNAIETESAAGNVEEVSKLGQAYTSTQQELERHMEEWMQLA